MNFKLIKVVALCLLVVFWFGQSVQADVVDDIKARGKLIVGVKADYKPYGFRDTSGKIVGIEPELAQEVADMLGVKLELVPVVASNRMEFLKQGKIDLMIATMTDRPDRDRIGEEPTAPRPGIADPSRNAGPPQFNGRTG